MKPKLLPAVKLPVFEQPKLVVPHEVRREAPQPVEAPKVVVNQFAAPQLKMAVGGARPQLVHTGDFGWKFAEADGQRRGGESADRRVWRSQWLAGNRQARREAIRGLGGMVLTCPSAPGQGNGSGGAKGIKGTVASADFGNGIATGGNGDGRSNGKGVATGGFGSEQVVHAGPKVVQADAGPATTPVEITFKPNPVYTDEARSLKLEGEVLLEVSFSANGTLHVNRVVRGLGHGLDEAAIAAANKIRFKPALRNGQPMDSTAIVHVTFQMAY